MRRKLISFKSNKTKKRLKLSSLFAVLGTIVLVVYASLLRRHYDAAIGIVITSSTTATTTTTATATATATTKTTTTNAKAVKKKTISSTRSLDKPSSLLLPKQVIVQASAEGSHLSPPSRMHEIRNISSIDYMACCGLGHRLSKLSDAYYASKVLGFSLRSFWGYCDDTKEVYNYLFGPQPASELQSVVLHQKHQLLPDYYNNHFVRINNEVPGFYKFSRSSTTDNTACPCVMDKAATDVEFYTNHRERFRSKHKVDDFRAQHFDTVNTSTAAGTPVVVGLHIRAGNGEAGDFKERGRAIHDADAWIGRVVDRILEQRQKTWNKPLVLFVATDTASMVPKLRNLLAGHPVSVLDLNQIRPKDGEGVMFGERGKVVTQGVKCKRSWETTVMDMILLSYADVVVAARPSSFTQSMPMSLVLSKPKDERKVPKPFCEMNSGASTMRCYEDFQEWCCSGDSKFALGDIQQQYEYLRMPEDAFDPRSSYKIQPRGPEGCIPRPEGWKQPCLPYDFTEHKIKPRKRQRKKSSG